MKTNESNPSHIIADEGKVFKRISDGFIYGSEIHLGYTHYIGGVKLEEPLLELPEHFEEVDEELFGPSEDATMERFL